MNRKARLRKKRIRVSLLGLVVIFGITAAAFAVKGITNNIKVPEDNILSNEEQQMLEQETVSETEKEPEPIPDVTINIKATGDIMFHPSQIDGAYNSLTGTYDFTNSFKAVKSIFQEADLAMANFEGTTAGNENYAYQGYPLFNAPDEVLDAIKDAGFDVLSTANNHSLDTGKAGIIRTVEQIKLRGMDSIGTYIKKPESRVLIKDVKGIKIAFLSYTEMVNGLDSLLSPEDLDTMINIINETKLKEDIAYAKEQNADVVIAYLHWGNEYSRIQTQEQENLADMLFKEGVDIILGSHPHVIQPTKILEYEGRTKFVAFSMGNFLSNQRVETLVPYGMTESLSKYTEDGVIIDIDIEKKGETGEILIKNIDYIPLWVYKGTTEDGRTEHIVVPIMDYVESNELDENSKSRMNRSYSDTMAQMNGE
ncbi:MAG: CapA family protein [Sedimentibacter sp.]|uniref:CapA family protein n=1 Tax=Sedimentibacter sp. TaxID=1960295 RepID=UPI0029819FBE|nr:CapA family protein [Sedimentibacter sp.]MDW5298594.1 CapA family protein [Sedimentibacter sp.]